MLRTMFVIVAAAAAWAAINSVRFVLDSSHAYRAESAWLIFAAVLVASGLAQRALRHVVATPQSGVTAWQAGAFVGLSLMLYLPIIGIGLLSDDFVLLEQVRHHELINRSWGFVRPLPLAIWWLVDQIGSTNLTPALLHVLNVALHGLNAWLVLMVARRFGLAHRTAVVSALLFLALPFNVEAVTWTSGVFDICMTTCALTAVVIATDAGKSRTARLGVVTILTGAAIASKETGIALPMLLLLTAVFTEGAEREHAIWCGVASGIVVGVYVAARLVFAPPSAVFPEAVLIKNKLLTRPFGALGVGIHHDVLQSSSLIGITLVLGWVALAVRAARRWNAQVFSITTLGVLWVLISVAPLWTLFFVTDTLEGSRYLYLASTVWAIAVVTLIANSTNLTRLTLASAAVIVIACAAIVILEQRPWREAAVVRNQVIDAWRAMPGDCDPRRASGLLDSVRGAYVFRNGFAEAVAGRVDDTKPCSAHWNGVMFTVEP